MEGLKNIGEGQYFVVQALSDAIDRPVSDFENDGRLQPTLRNYNRSTYDAISQAARQSFENVDFDPFMPQNVATIINQFPQDKQDRAVNLLQRRSPQWAAAVGRVYIAEERHESTGRFAKRNSDPKVTNSGNHRKAKRRYDY